MVEVSIDKVVGPFEHAKTNEKARSSSTTASNMIW